MYQILHVDAENSMPIPLVRHRGGFGGVGHCKLMWARFADKVSGLDFGERVAFI